jgi:hypothetical protein
VKFSFLVVGALSALALVAESSGTQAALVDAPVPDSAYITIGDLDWAWASPVAGDGSFGQGAVDLSFQSAFGWRVPTATDLLNVPSALDFLVADGNVPLGGTDPVSGAHFFAGTGNANLTGPAAVAVPYFNNNFFHADWCNAPGSGGGCASGFGEFPWWPSAGFFNVSESLVVRDSIDDVPPVPLPPAFALFASGLVGLGWFARRRKKQAA